VFVGLHKAYISISQELISKTSLDWI